MTSPLPLPDWVPWWVHLVVLLAILMFALLFLLMPFSVFGVKARLEGIEVRLDEIQGEIRNLALRLPDAIDPGDDYVDERGRPIGPQNPHPTPFAPSRTDPRVRRDRTEPRLY